MGAFSVMYEKKPANFLGEDELLNGLSISVFLISPGFEILRVNQASQTLCQCGASKLEGSSIATVFSNPSGLVSALRRALNEARPFTERDLQLHVKGVGATTVDCHISPLFDPNGGVSFLLLELSTLDRYQRISRSGRVEMDNDLTQELLKGLAHEIKNPLGGIRGAAQLLDDEIGEALREYTQVIIRETDRLKCLVDNMFGPRG
jgi:Signal transduction histidine kinase, nitrogen specific